MALKAAHDSGGSRLIVDLVVTDWSQLSRRRLWIIDILSQDFLDLPLPFPCRRTLSAAFKAGKKHAPVYTKSTFLPRRFQFTSINYITALFSWNRPHTLNAPFCRRRTRTNWIISGWIRRRNRTSFCTDSGSVYFRCCWGLYWLQRRRGRGFESRSPRCRVPPGKAACPKLYSGQRSNDALRLGR